MVEFIICTSHEILLGWSNERMMVRVGECCTYEREDKYGRGGFEHLGVGRRGVLIVILN